MHAHLHQAGRGIVVLVELDCDLVLASGALRNMVQRYLEVGLAVAIEAEHRTSEINGAPVPALQRQLLLQHVQGEALLKVGGNALLVAQPQAAVAVQRAVLHEQSQPKVTDKALEVGQLDVGGCDLFDLASFAVLKDDASVGDL